MPGDGAAYGRAQRRVNKAWFIEDLTGRDESGKFHLEASSTSAALEIFL
jgi:hypothetical protein